MIVYINDPEVLMSTLVERLCNGTANKTGAAGDYDHKMFSNTSLGLKRIWIHVDIIFENFGRNQDKVSRRFGFLLAGVASEAICPDKNGWR